MSEAELYERFVKTLYEEYMLPSSGSPQDYILHHRKTYAGQRTGNQHEIDLSFEATVGSLRILVMIECKHYRRRLGKDVVEQLRSKMDDIGAHKGVIVTTVGFQKGALRAAKSYGIALVIATVEPGWFDDPDSTALFDPQWHFMNYGYIPVPFFGPWPIGCSHHAKYLVSGLLSSLEDEVEGRVPPWHVHPHLPPEGRSIIYEDGVYDELGRISEDPGDRAT